MYGISTPLVESHLIYKLIGVGSVENKYQQLLETIAANIKKARKSKGLSQRDMELYGFDLRNYQRLEAGDHSPSLYTLHKLSLIFKVDVSDLTK